MLILLLSTFPDIVTATALPQIIKKEDQASANTKDVIATILKNLDMDILLRTFSLQSFLSELG